jgi:hypothetical protein
MNIACVLNMLCNYQIPGDRDQNNPCFLQNKCIPVRKIKFAKNQIEEDVFRLESILHILSITEFPLKTNVRKV